MNIFIILLHYINPKKFIRSFLHALFSHLFIYDTKIDIKLLLENLTKHNYFIIYCQECNSVSHSRATTLSLPKSYFKNGVEKLIMGLLDEHDDDSPQWYNIVWTSPKGLIPVENIQHLPSNKIRLPLIEARLLLESSNKVHPLSDI